MQKRILNSAWSVLRSPKRMRGRSVGTEIICRTLQGLFSDGDERGVEWLRRKLNNPGLKHKAQEQVTASQVTMAGVACQKCVPNTFAEPDSSIDKVLVYLHGGGFVAGSPKGYGPLIAQLSHNAQVTVIAADYRLSPEHAFPIPQDDCMSVVKQVQEQYPNAKVILGGDSAGGNLAVGVTLALAQDKHAKMVDALMLLSPWLEPTASEGTIHSNVANDIFKPDFLSSSYAAHMGDADLHNPRVNFAKVDLSPLPMTYTQVAGGELFLDQVVSFHQRAKQAGVNTSLDVFKTQFHDFQTFSPLLKDARQAVHKLSEFLTSI